MSGRGVGAGSGRSGKSFEQLEREFVELRRLVKDLIQPKSRARIIISGGAGDLIEYTITSIVTSTEPDYVGLEKATVVVRGGPAGLIGTSVSVYDHSGCIFDEVSMVGYTGWAFRTQYRTLDTSKACEVLTPFHWAAINRCCDANSGTYRSC